MVNSKFVSSIVIGLLLATAGASAKSNHGIPTAHPVAHHVAQAGEIVGAAEAVGGAAATAYGAYNHDQSVQDAGEAAMGVGAATGLGSHAVAKNTQGPVPGRLYAPAPKHGRKLQRLPWGRKVLMTDDHGIPQKNGFMEAFGKIVGGAGELFNNSMMEQWGDKIAENNQGPVPGRYYAPNPMAKTGRKLQKSEVEDPKAGGIDFGHFIDNDAEAVEKDAIHELVPATKNGPLINLKAVVPHAYATLPIRLPSFGRKLLLAN